MKYCPTCETRYDEEILRFCMKDGTPLLDEEEPKFVAMPSESLNEVEDDDPGDVTVVRRNISVPPESETERPRIVVPTYEGSRRQETRARVAPPYQAPRNTAKVVFLTILGTLAVLGVFGTAMWLLTRDHASNSNANVNMNANVNVNANTNLGIDTNFNFNLNGNFNSATNVNTNANANLKTPTPTPTRTPTPTPSPTPADDDATPTPSRTPIPTPQPTIIRPGVSPTPRPASTPSRNLNGGVLNGMAVSLPRPIYPPMAKQIGVGGQVRVQVSVDSSGNVISARAVSGHPMLRSAAESAARQSKMRVDAANMTGQIVYNFRSN
jgi:TonB family protein